MLHRSKDRVPNFWGKKKREVREGLQMRENFRMVKDEPMSRAVQEGCRNFSK